MENAITFGRYNPCTIAHIHTIEKIVELYKTVTVGVIEDCCRPLSESNNAVYAQYCKLADTQNDRTVFSIEERVRLMELSLQDMHLRHKVSVLPIKRPEYHPKLFGLNFPPSAYHMAFPAVGLSSSAKSSCFDEIRNEVLPKMLERNLHFIETNFTLHVSEIIKKSNGDSSVWKQCMTPAAHNFFTDINGPERLLLTLVPQL